MDVCGDVTLFLNGDKTFGPTQIGQLEKEVKMPLSLLLLLALWSAHAQIAVRIQPQLPVFTANAPILISIEVSGNGSVSKWDLPQANPLKSQFSVLLDGIYPVSYLGRVGKRLEINEIFNAHENFTIDLSTLYNFSLQGTYHVQFHTALVSNTVLLVAEARAEPPQFANKLVKCPTTYQNQFILAQTNALTLTISALKHLDNAKSSKYKIWFGAKTKSRVKTVKKHFTKIGNVLRNGKLVADCSCMYEDDYYAYVYPARTAQKTVYLCGAFWSAKQLGFDSKAGTLIHEISHFRDIAKTDDIRYSQELCKLLAKTSPKKAIRNADSHEYYAESNV